MQSSNIFSESPEFVQTYLGLGSNMGDRRINLERALQLLSQKIRLVLVSPIYDTAPVGNIRQERFLNLVCEAATTLKPIDLLALVKKIERNMGRPPGPANSPRPIDIDILFYGKQIINTPELIIPHPRLPERAFVLIPLADIAPDYVHPSTGKSINQILKAMKVHQDDVVKWENRRGERCTK